MRPRPFMPLIDTRPLPRLAIPVEVCATSGRASCIEFLLAGAAVEVLHREHRYASLDRAYLRSWLQSPEEPYSIDQVTLSLDASLDPRGRIAITLPIVTEWTLSDSEVTALRKWV